MTKHESPVAFIFGLFCKLFLVIDTLSEKLLIHEYNHTVFFVSLLIMPVLIYAIKNIPIRYTVYEASTNEKLDIYDYQLERLKFTYDKLSREMNNAAVIRSGCDMVGNSANSIVNSIVNGEDPLAGLNI